MAYSNDNSVHDRVIDASEHSLLDGNRLLSIRG